MKLQAAKCAVDIISSRKALLLSCTTIIAAFPLLYTDYHRWIFYIGFLPLFFANLKKAELVKTTRNPAILALLVFLIYSWSSQFWSPDLSIENVFNTTRESIYLLIFIYSIIMLRITYGNFLPRVLLPLAAVCALTALAMMVLAVVDWQWPPQRMSSLGRGDNPIIAALIFAVAAAGAYGLAASPTAPRALRLSFGLVLAAIVCGIFLTQSRGPWIAFFLAVLVVLALQHHWLPFAALALVAAAAASVFAFSDLSDPWFIERGTSDRLQLWSQALQDFRQNPLFGLGWETNLHLTGRKGMIKSPHNAYLSILAFTGITGLSVFLFIVAYTLKKLPKYDAPTWPTAGILTIGLVANVFDGYFPVENLGFQWLILWLPVSYIIAGDIASRHGARRTGDADSWLSKLFALRSKSPQTKLPPMAAVAATLDGRPEFRRIASRLYDHVRDTASPR